MRLTLMVLAKALDSPKRCRHWAEEEELAEDSCIVQVYLICQIDLSVALGSVAVDIGLGARFVGIAMTVGYEKAAAVRMGLFVVDYIEEGLGFDCSQIPVAAEATSEATAVVPSLGVIAIYCHSCRVGSSAVVLRMGCIHC